MHSANLKAGNFDEATVDDFDDWDSTPTAVRFMCYISNKSSSLAQYELEIKEGQILIISPLKEKVRQRLDLANIHAKEAPK